MYKYHLFIINNDAYKIYRNNTNYLYQILYTLFKLKKENIIYGYKLYNDICSIFSVKLLKNYFLDRFNIEVSNNYLYLQNTNDLIRITPSHILVISNNIKPKVFRILNIYNKKIIAVDFKNKKYFWLNDN